MDKIKEWIKTLSTKILLFVEVVLAVFVLMIIAGAILDPQKCYMRYSTKLTTSKSVIMRADGQVSAGIPLDPAQGLSVTAAYGRWIDSGLAVKAGQKIDVSIKGVISLCWTYLPPNNVMRDQNLDQSSQQITMYKLDDALPGLPLIVDAKKSCKWRNVAYLNKGDKVRISIGRNFTPASDSGNTSSIVMVENIFDASVPYQGNCQQKQTSYSPVCGRYATPTKSNNICQLSPLAANDPIPEFTSEKTNSGQQAIKWNLVYKWQTPDLPLQYLDNGYHSVGSAKTTIDANVAKVTCDKITSQFKEMQVEVADDVTTLDISQAIKKATATQYLAVTDILVGDSKLAIPGTWFTPEQNPGLLYRITADGNAGSGVAVDAVMSYQAPQNSPIPILDIVSGASGFLQYKLDVPEADCDKNTGGYVLYVKQDSCLSTNGQGTGNGADGMVAYAIVDPNVTYPSDIQENAIPVDNAGIGSISAGNSGGKLWLKVINSKSTYTKASGNYTVLVATADASISSISFLDNYITPHLTTLVRRINCYGLQALQALTCSSGLTTPVYNCSSNSSAPECYCGVGAGSDKCTSFFKYIHVALTFYILILGAKFTLGMLQMNQYELLIHLIKVIAVGGLMNGKTYSFFITYLYPIIDNFVDSIIISLNGYSSSNISTQSALFTSIDPLLSRIFLEGVFLWQLVALLGTGLSGVAYLLIIAFSLYNIVIKLYEMFIVYVVAKLGVAVLLGLGPVFLVFVLFSQTKAMFSIWLKALCRYLMEPVIYIAGLSILIKLYTIYLDYVLSYSVCWRCSLIVNLPLNWIGSDSSIPLFCLSYPMPWGFDPSFKNAGLDITNIIALLLIAHCVKSYSGIAQSVASSITGGAKSFSAIGT